MKFKQEVEKFNNFKSKINKSVIIIENMAGGKSNFKKKFFEF